MYFFDELANFDPEVAAACSEELARQRRNIELIASENIVSKAVLLAAGPVLTNKYAEGFPGKRYFGKPCRVLCLFATRRYRYGHEFGAWRTSFAWFARQYFGQILQRCAV